MCFLEGDISLLNPLEHLVEGPYEYAHFIVAVGARTQRVVFSAGNTARDL
jgi:hypothetical protein